MEIKKKEKIENPVNQTVFATILYYLKKARFWRSFLAQFFNQFRIGQDYKLLCLCRRFSAFLSCCMKLNQLSTTTMQWNASLVSLWLCPLWTTSVKTMMIVASLSDKACVFNIKHWLLIVNHQWNMHYFKLWSSRSLKNYCPILLLLFMPAFQTS